MTGIEKANKRVFDQNKREGIDFEEVCVFGRLNGASEVLCCFVKSILRIYDCIRLNVLISDWFGMRGAIGICKVPIESFLRKSGTCFCCVQESHVTTICLEHLVHGNNKRNCRVISSWDFVLSLFAFIRFEIDGAELWFRQGMRVGVGMEMEMEMGMRIPMKEHFRKKESEDSFSGIDNGGFFKMFIDFVIF
jgi:hypothetical protein